MHIFGFNRLPVFEAPEVASGAGKQPAVDPAVAAATDPAAAPPAAPPAAVDPVAAADPATDTAANPEQKQHGNKGQKPWFLARISEESERARAAEERARNAEAMLARQQKTDPPANGHDGEAIEARARQLAEERIAADKISSVVNAGLAKFGDWDEKAQMLAAVGAASPAFVLDVVTIDPANAHEILHALADDPQKAARLAKMDARSRTVELVRMSMALSGGAPTSEQKPEPKPPTPKSVSKAPAPPPAIDPSTAPSADWRNDKTSDADFSKGWEEEQRKRAQRGRR